LSTSNARKGIALGALLVTSGLTIAATAPIPLTGSASRTDAQQLAGGLALLVGALVLAWGIHRFGRES
jgi:hypothetical protein